MKFLQWIQLPKIQIIFGLFSFYLITLLVLIDMETPAMRLYLSPDVTNNIHGKTKNNSNYTNNNPSAVEKIPYHMRGQDILEEVVNSMASNLPVWNFR